MRRMSAEVGSYFARKNELGFWVGWLRDEDNTEYPVTNAFQTKAQAEDVAARVLESKSDPKNGMSRNVSH